MPYLPNHRWASLAATALIVFFFTMYPHSAYAQAPISSTVGQGSNAANTVAVAPVEAPASQEDTVFGALVPTTWDWALRVLSAAFLSALGAWAILMVFRYVTNMQGKYYDLTGTLANRGQSTQPIIISTSKPVSATGQLEAFPMAAAAPASPETVTKLLVKGPNITTVNIESPPFTAALQQGDQETPVGDAVTWQIDPVSAGTLSQTTGASVRVTPKQVGAFQLIVKLSADADDSTAVHVPVSVVAPASGSISLPFIGEGWGTIVLAILFGLIIALLGLSRVLSTALVGTLLGALLGYIFGMVSPSLSGTNRRQDQAGTPTTNNDSRQA